MIEMKPDWGVCSGLFLRSNNRGQCYQMMVDYHDRGNVGHIYGEGTGGFNTRTFDVFVTPTDKDLRFVRPGLAVFVEIITKTSGASELAIPKSCVLPDGLDRVFFRRDPNNKDLVIRIVGDFGAVLFCQRQHTYTQCYTECSDRWDRVS